MSPVTERIKPLRDHIAFEFIDGTKSGQVVDKTDWGFEFQVSTANTKQPPRWGRILATGPKAASSECAFAIGSYILIEPLMWTNKQHVDDLEFWYTSADRVMLYSEEAPR